MKLRKLSPLSTKIFIIMAILLVLPGYFVNLSVVRSLERTIRTELDKKVTQTIQASQIEINSIFQKMANISTVFYYNPLLREGFGPNSELEYYDRFVIFLGIIQSLEMQNIYEDIFDYVKITFIDLDGKVYTDWSVPPSIQNFDTIANRIEQVKARKGFVVWDITPQEGKGQLVENSISCARTIMDPNYSHIEYGTIIISVDYAFFHSILKGLAYDESDLVFASNEDGELFLFTDSDQNQVLMNLAAQEAKGNEGNKKLTFDGKTYLMSYYTLGPSGFLSKMNSKIIYLSDYNSIQRQANALVFNANIANILFILLSAVIAWVIAYTIAAPIRKLSSQMAMFKLGEESPQSPELERADEIGEIYQSYGQLTSEVNNLFTKLNQERDLKEYYYHESLKSKVSPHFLFNTLTNIRWMAIFRKADNIRESIDALVNILRYSLTSGEEEISLQCELDVVKDYHHIQDVRFGNSCSLHIDVPEKLLSCSILKFILQPVMENSFRHGFSLNTPDCNLEIKIWEEGELLFIDMSDNGVGFDEKALEKILIERSGQYQGGIGLRLVQKRIQIAYGPEYGLTVLPVEVGASIRFTLPLKWEKETHEARYGR